LGFFFVGGILLGAYLYMAALSDCWLPGRSSARKPDCVLSLLPEDVPEMMEAPYNQTTYKGCTYIFVVVENIGDTANFAAQFSTITGLRRSGDSLALDEYFGKVAWEDTIDDRQVLGSGSQAKLITMCLFREPKLVGWFQIPYSAKWARHGDTGRHQLAGWLLEPTNPGGNIGFELKVVNETKKSSGTWHVGMVWNVDGTVGSTSMTPL
jgi:hypothetical protein